MKNLFYAAPPRLQSPLLFRQEAVPKAEVLEQISCHKILILVEIF
jgi:hypothetical protein